MIFSLSGGGGGGERMGGEDGRRGWKEGRKGETYFWEAGDEDGVDGGGIGDAEGLGVAECCGGEGDGGEVGADV